MRSSARAGSRASAAGWTLSGQLATEAIDDVCEAVADYISRYEDLGARPVAAIATSAVRDASNGDAFLAELRERFALDSRILSGRRRRGSPTAAPTAEQPPSEPTLVIDIGGGTTELVVGVGRARSASTPRCRRASSATPSATSAPTRRRPPSSRSSPATCAALIDAALADRDHVRRDAGIAVAGTPTSLAAIDLELDPYDPEAVHGHVSRLTDDPAPALRARLDAARERLEIAGLHPDRAPTIVAGVVILIEVMRAFGLDEIEVSEHDILYGAALEAAA